MRNGTVQQILKIESKKWKFFSRTIESLQKKHQAMSIITRNWRLFYIGELVNLIREGNIDTKMVHGKIGKTKYAFQVKVFA